MDIEKLIAAIEEKKEWHKKLAIERKEKSEASLKGGFNILGQMEKIDAAYNEGKEMGLAEAIAIIKDAI